ncbi:hypothetical protein [Paraburkholderia susongensis]|uniref:Uncharacterized protein n=1 Tax=Paraburkholderia susongensis TaxID=1515439 RepID=A0A1X7KQF8_9BURK|nr:hypothetical protein [Paraburkholderia susongensis]SMG43365.1 hypothetical protein SAMN06265784_104154 [Paraburkholderia susongensis]
MSNITTAEVLKLFEDESEDLKEIVGGDWEIDYKDYASRSTVQQHVPTGRYFSITENRSGSYYTDYFYGDSDCTEVEPVEVTVTQYRAVKG